MAKKKLSDCRKGSDFVSYARKQGAEVRNGKGSHFIVSGERGQCVVPCHNDDLGTGLRVKIVKTFLLIGLVMMPLLCLLSAIVM